MSEPEVAGARPTKPTAASPPADAAKLPTAVIDRLTQQLRRSRCYLEFGSGGSTLLAARLGVPHIITVESDARFLAEIVSRVHASGHRVTLHPVHADIGPTGAWGRPVDTSAFPSWHRYAQAGFLEAARLKRTPDVILIDGRFRVACFLAALLCVPPGTPIVFDDYAHRSGYHVVERFAPLEELVDRAALFTVPDSVDAREAAFALARYSVIPK